MNVRVRGRPWLAMAVLAVLSLAVTVYFARRALGDASDIVVRGESDVLLSTLVPELVEEGLPPTVTQLDRALAAHASSGLRYVAIVDRSGRALSEAGEAQMRDVVPRPGQFEELGRRVRASAPLMPRRRGSRAERPPPWMGPASLVIELEPPVIEKLRADLTRIAIVAALAGAVLLAFAIAWSRSAARLAAVEHKAVREQRLVALGSMSSVMAHELRNPLASLKGHAQLLVEDLDDPKKKAKAERVVREAERLEGLTTSLLDFVRDGPIERAGVSPADLVARSLEHVDADRVDVDLRDAPERLFVDEARLSRALHNLVDNALQSTANNQRVDLRVAEEGRDVVIEVRDHGAGIPPGTEAQIFEPFHTTRTRGTGLGLAVSRRIAEQHGGSLTGDNHPGGGALFRLRFVNEGP